MKNLPVSTIASSMSLEIVTNIVDSYFNYKKETKIIEYETKKLKSQTKLIIKKLEADTKSTLDNNQKMYDIEAKRIDLLATQLQDSSKKKKKILKQSKDVIKILKKSSKNSVDNEMIATFLSFLNNQYSNESALCTNLLDSLTHFDNTQNITYQKGEK